MPKTGSRADADFEAFYERHWKYVYRLCFTYMRNSADAEDCAEDVFVKVFSGNFSFIDETHERKWLCVTAINLCKDRLRAVKRHGEVPLGEAVEVPLEGNEHPEVLEAVLALPDKYKDVIWLFYYDGYQTDEIARMLKRPPSTVRNQLRDARSILKDKLGGERNG